MPVIINEFDVVTEAPQPPQTPEAPPAPAASAPASTPLDIRRILEQQISRFLRVWAH